MDNFERLLRRDGPVILDGGLATRLEATGHDIASRLWSASLLASNPGAIVDAHRAYLDAGADVIISASYQASRNGFMSQGFDADEADRLIVSAVRLALRARDAFVADGGAGTPLVAASVGPYAAARADGSEYTGEYDASDGQLREFHAERLPLLDAAGADLLAVETIPNAREARVLRELLEDVATPAWVSFACRDAQYLSDGTPLRDAAALYAGHPRVYAVGINCTPPRYVLPLIAEVRAAAADKAVVVYPNSGETWHSKEKRWSGKACDFNRDFDVEAWYAAGAKLIGGCCRTGPADIAAIGARLRSRAA